MPTDTITVPAGQTQITIPISVAGDPHATEPETFLVELVGNPTYPTQGIYSATNSTATVTIVEQNPQISIENLTMIGGSAATADVLVRLSQAEQVPVMFQYTTATDTVHPGTIPAGAGVDYQPITTPQFMTIPAGQTEVMIPIAILTDANLSDDATFLVNISNPSLGTIVSNNQTTGSGVPAGQATVTLLASNPANTSPLQFQQANSLTNTTLDTSASGPNSPADPSGAVGTDSIVLMDSNTYQVLDKADGVVSQTSTLNQFWADALGPEISIENSTAYETGTGSTGQAFVTVRLSSAAPFQPDRPIPHGGRQRQQRNRLHRDRIADPHVHSDRLLGPNDSHHALGRHVLGRQAIHRRAFLPVRREHRKLGGHGLASGQ